MEFLFGFPLILILMMAIFQFAQLEIARLVVHYAAYCGARAALVHHETEASLVVQKVAERVCAWITFDDYPDDGGGTASPIVIPGWGNIPNSEATVRKTTSTYTYLSSEMAVKVQVKHKLSLLAPVIGPMIVEGLQWWNPQPDGNAEMFTTDGTVRTSLYPSLEIPATCIMTKPYKTIHCTGPLP